MYPKNVPVSFERRGRSSRESENSILGMYGSEFGDVVKERSIWARVPMIRSRSLPFVT